MQTQYDFTKMESQFETEFFELIRAFYKICGSGFETIEPASEAPPADWQSPSAKPIPARALRHDRQPIGMFCPW